MTKQDNSIEMENAADESSQHKNGEKEIDEIKEDVSVFISEESGKENSSNSFVNNFPSSRENIETQNDTSHTKQQKIFDCDICNMKFSNLANMRRHKLRHTGFKPFECKLCKKRFFRKDHLAEHCTTHTKSFPYHCPICNLGFRKQLPMKEHFQNEHIGADKIKSCPLCGFRSKVMKDLKLHFLNVHGMDVDNPSENVTCTPTFSTDCLMNGGELEIHCNDDVLHSSGFSDSGESTGSKSFDSDIPPTHFLKNYLEISITPSDSQLKTTVAAQSSSSASVKGTVTTPSLLSTLINSNKKVEVNGTTNNTYPSSPESVDSNSNDPTLAIKERSMNSSLVIMPIKQDQDEKKFNSSTPHVQKSNSKSFPKSSLKSLLEQDLNRRTDMEFSSTTTSRSASPESSVSSLKCLFCGILFPDRTLYFLHKGCHSDVNPWRCNICGEQSLNVYDFNSHLLSKTHE